MILQITAYGIARDIAGNRVFEFEAPATVTVESLKRQLLERFPALGNLTSFQIAVNAELGPADSILTETDEIVLLPPVSGG